MKKLKLMILLVFVTLISKSQPTTLISFDGTNGGNPYGDLISDGTYLYGMTTFGGTPDNYGVVFKIKPDGTAYTILLNFNGTNGQTPSGSLIYDGTYLYGMTEDGGVNSSGNIFKIKPDGSNFTKIFDFSKHFTAAYGGTGGTPYGSLIYDGTYLYGTTQGYTGNTGTLFKIKPDGTGFVNLKIFNTNNTDGYYPLSTLLMIGNNIYGMAYSNGGSNENGWGTIFRIKSDGTKDTTLFVFNGANGGKPKGALIYDGTFLYGMTSDGSGASDSGSVFKIKPDGTGFALLKSFTSGNITNGVSPLGSLVYDGTYLYGMTNGGGCITNPTGTGIIFKIKPDGTNFTKLMYFPCPNNNGDNSIGLNPHGSFMIQGSFLYGMAYGGGAFNNGTVFKYQFKPCTTVTYIQSPTICPGDTLVVGIHTYSATGTYTDTLTQRISGCDSIVTTNLNVLLTNKTNQSFTKCAGYNLVVGTHTYTNTGIFKDTLISHKGCDSIVTTNLTIRPANAFTMTINKCAGQNINVIVGNHTYTVSGTYKDTLTSLVNGCDSLQTTHIIVNPLPTVTITANGSTSINQGNSVTLTATAASHYLWSNNATTQSVTVSSSGNYSVTVTNTYSCSANSAITTVTVISLPPTPTISVSGSTFTSSATGANQWYLNGNIINGATSQTYIATQSGIYTVKVSNGNGGYSTSAPYSYSISTVIPIVNENNNIVIIPNPSNGIFQLNTQNIEVSRIIIYNVLGEIIYQTENQISEIDLSVHPKGVYFMEVYTQNQVFKRKLIIQ
jgi:uncharacterized repeat protein (TIGR03803 family)